VGFFFIAALRCPNKKAFPEGKVDFSSQTKKIDEGIISKQKILYLK